MTSSISFAPPAQPLCTATPNELSAGAQAYYDRPLNALFLIRGTEKSMQHIQSVRGLVELAGKYRDDTDMHAVLMNGGSVTLATFTTVAEACEHLVTHKKTGSRFPFCSLRDLHTNDVPELAKFVLENHASQFHLMFDKPECYAEEYRHLLPDL